MCTQNEMKKILKTCTKMIHLFGQVGVALEPVQGVAEGPNLSGDASQILEDFPLRVQDLDALGVRVVAGSEVLGDG